MEGLGHARSRRLGRTALATTFLLAALPGTGQAADADVNALPDCAVPDGSTDAEVAAPWQVVLDADGAVVGHRMTLRHGGRETTLRTGRRGFAVDAGAGRLLIGERGASTTTLTMVDTHGLCRVWQRTLDRAIYDRGESPVGDTLRLDALDPTTRWYDGQLVIGLEDGASEAMIEGQCSVTCTPNDGGFDVSTVIPAGAPRPVPAFAAGSWPRDTTLPFSWKDGDVPPEWARDPLRAGAEDASDTSASRSPRFVYRSTANDTIRYTPAFPDFCRFGIACASRNMPGWWAVWIRPHGTDFAWGTLRWCQKSDNDGCFDLRRVIIHELGHVMGLDHPSNAGFNLGPSETVMHAVTPARPSAGSARHAFGRCDVATLQELYDVPTNGTAISTCNDVDTRLELSASAASVTLGDPVRLRALLRISDRAALGQLADNPLNGRSVKLKYRRADSAEGWTVLWMAPESSGGRYELSLAPRFDVELQATFPAPDDEGLRFSASEVVKVKVTR